MRWFVLLALLPGNWNEAHANRFVDVAKESGIVYVGKSYGPAAADFDADGDIDLAVSLHGSIAIFENNGNGTFTDKRLLDGNDTHGIAWADIDGNGLLDLYVAVGAGRGFGKGDNLWLRNGPKGLEGSSAPAALRDPQGRSRCGIFDDFDGDGALDLLTGNVPQQGRMHQWIRSMKEPDSIGLEAIDALCFSRLDDSSDNTRPLWIGYGKKRLSMLQRSEDSELLIQRELLEMGREAGSTQAVTAGDIDNDGDLDLYIVRGGHQPTEVDASPQRIRFRLVSTGNPTRLRFRPPEKWRLSTTPTNTNRPIPILSARSGELVLESITSSQIPIEDTSPKTIAGSPAMAVSRVDEYQFEIVFVGDRRDRAMVGELLAEDGTFGEVSTDPPAPQNKRFRNRLLRNDGGHWTDITRQSGTGNPLSGRDAFFVDMDNDSDLDLFVVNGGGSFSNHPDALYENVGGGQFKELHDWSGGSDPALGRGAGGLAFDYDSNGTLDLLVTNGEGAEPGNAGPVTLWKNTSSGNHWAQLDVRGGDQNHFAVGTHATAIFGDGQTQLQVRSSTTGRFSSSLLPFHFGLGERSEIVVRLLWPDGTRENVSLRHGERLVVHQKVAE